MVTFLVAFFGKGFIPGRPEKPKPLLLKGGGFGELLLFRKVGSFVFLAALPNHPPLS